ncbi:hypothetical protein M3204_10070 [Mesobacillus subterraneus]|uniref:hypothetical protein n=1 Tax=Mesobacillus subterraneus TaxID=285983 RepID=UPI00203B9F85|nr:hypothetical protein [Mesobacillus subterraneus]MCM3664751.1 hypothetical protein [Mesobacillus subterraneus]MCM3681840.1 hypothetical protein [Mesobacillus subterraneus]
MLWMIIVLLFLILIDVVRLHKKIDKLTNQLDPVVPPTEKEIEEMLDSETTSFEK